MSNRIADFEIFLIQKYRQFSYPIYSYLDKKGLNFVRCSYNPSCSHYFEQAVKKYGIISGSLKGLERILRCQPSRKIIEDPLK